MEEVMRKPMYRAPLLWVVAQVPLLAATMAFAPIQSLLQKNIPWFGLWVLPVQAMGAVLLIMSGTIFVRAAKSLGSDLVPSPSPKPGSALRQSGVYGAVRHPMYLAVIIGGFGWSLLWASVPTLLLASACLGFFLLKARYEEGLLMRHFPGYDAYRARTPAFIPRRGSTGPHRS